MDQSLYKFLVLNGHLSIPQLGSFIIKQLPAHSDAASGLLYPPKPVISFTQGEILMSEKLFFDFLSNELGIDEVTAIKQFHEFADHFRNELEEKKLVSLKGVGVVGKGEDGSMHFEPATNLSNLLPALQIDESILYAEADNELEQSSKHDYWWFYAIILLILGVGALVYYYI